MKNSKLKIAIATALITALTTISIALINNFMGGAKVEVNKHIEITLDETIMPDGEINIHQTIKE